MRSPCIADGNKSLDEQGIDDFVSAAAGTSPAAVHARSVPLQQVHVLGTDVVFCAKICT